MQKALSSLLVCGPDWHGLGQTIFFTSPYFHAINMCFFSYSRKRSMKRRKTFFIFPSFYFFFTVSWASFGALFFSFGKEKSISPAFFSFSWRYYQYKSTATISLALNSNSLSCTLLQSHCHCYIIEKISMYFLFSCTSLHICMYVFDGGEGKKKRECCYWWRWCLQGVYAAGGCSYFSHVVFFYRFLQVLFLFTFSLYHYHFPGVALFSVKCVVAIKVSLLIPTKALMMMFMVMFIDLNCILL